MKTATMTWLALVAVVTLSGCGSSGGNDSPSAGSNVSNLSSINDSSTGFIAYIRSVIAQSPDNTEPASADGINATADDSDEPEAL